MVKMKLLGRWSLASFMKLAVDVPYYLLLVILPVAVGLALWMGLTRGLSGVVRLEVPVQFEIDSAGQPSAAARHGVEAASITKAHGTLTVSRVPSGAGVLWIGLGAGLVGLSVALLVLNRLRAIFRTLKDQNPFVALNASRIRMIGIVLILGELTSAGVGAWLAARVAREVSVPGITLRTDLAVNTWVIFAGVILFMLAEVFRLGAEMKGDLETARRIQAGLVPAEFFRKNQAEVHARMRTAKIVGGDYYDFLDLGGSGLAVIVGDVAGKGLPAAMLMASVVGSMRALASAGLRGGELIAALNRHVCTNMSGGRFVTLFYGELDTTTGKLRYVNAGHNPPILLHADGSVDRLQPTSMVLGIMADAPVDVGLAEVGPTDRLLLFTDGYSEAWNKKEEEYGEERLAESLVRAKALLPPAAMERLTADVLSFCGSVPPRDDMTLMLVARQPA
jgi:hypothetical protein